MALLELKLLGGLTLQQDDGLLTDIKSQKGVALLCYLVVSRRQATRPFLAALFWPDMPETQALMNLRKVLQRLQPLRPYLIITRETVAFNQDAEYCLDVAEFEGGKAVSSFGNAQDGSMQAVPHDITRLQKATSLYQGDFLDGFMLADAPLFEEWVLAQRARLREVALAALQRLIAHFGEEGGHETAVAYARQLLTIEPWHEETHRELMRLLALSGQRSAALVQYEICRRLLADELGIEPAMTTVQLVEQIKTGELGRAAEEQRNRRGVLPPHNLPTQATPFIGRSEELATLAGFLADSPVRLVTIVGVGGMGKTRLALAAAERCLTTDSPFAHGVFFVNLAPLNEAEQMVSAVTNALNFPLQGGDGRSPQQQLLDYLRPKKMLLLLDNFEHLLGGVDLLADILQGAPKVQILVTSRERLHTRLEQVYPIEGLEFPDWETASPDGEGDDAEGYTAVQLFLHSARRNQPDFALLDSDDLIHLAHICRTVAGMPLALELAASWVDMLPLAEIAAELHQGLGFLETDIQDMPERHRSVRAAIDHSWQKLDEKERDIFAKLSVLQGGFTREAAQAVAGANLQQLARLVRKSLLQGGKDGRYQIHELLRQYGAETLAESGQETAVRVQHSSFFCVALQRWETALNSKRLRATVGEIEADYRNIQIAWEYALDMGNLENLLIAVNGLGDYYDANGRWYEGIRFFEESARRLQPNPGLPVTAEVARLLVWLSAWQAHLDINARGNNVDPQNMYQHLLKPGLDLLEQLALSGIDSRAEEAYLRLQLGRILRRIDSQWEEGQAHLATCQHLYKELGNLLGVSDALYESYYYTTDRALPEQAQEQLQESLGLLQQLDEPRRLIRVYAGLSTISQSLQAFAEAATLIDQAYTTAQATGHLLGMWDARHIAIQQAWFVGQFDLALSYSDEAFTLAEQANSSVRVAVSLSLIGVTQVYSGQILLALELFQKTAQYRAASLLNPDLDVGWMGVGLPQAHLHAGHYERIVSLVKTQGESWDLMLVLVWVYLARAEYLAALSLAQKHFAQQRPHDHEGCTRIRIPLALALHGLSRQVEARWELYHGLQTCLEIRAFIPLMHLIPVTARVLADTADAQQKERAVELWEMAESLPFVSNSQLFADLLGQPMAAVAVALSPQVVAAAQARGRELDWWPTAESLLAELQALGWNEMRPAPPVVSPL